MSKDDHDDADTPRQALKIVQRHEIEALNHENIHEVAVEKWLDEPDPILSPLSQRWSNCKTIKQTADFLYIKIFRAVGIGRGRQVGAEIFQLWSKAVSPVVPK